ncbi:uncharacterized protein LOC126839355 [Adelges cooleyi]|uniref:uncharacterized protein LOC126839355 n=1 Tax=Adelges cooleyi TaxID=133065 RepID=UPI0021801EB5|nr:uncharacterized protein LOC126839355 [Adelges cooleyi]
MGQNVFPLLCYRCPPLFVAVALLCSVSASQNHRVGRSIIQVPIRDQCQCPSGSIAYDGQCRPLFPDWGDYDLTSTQRQNNANAVAVMEAAQAVSAATNPGGSGHPYGSQTDQDAVNTFLYAILADLREPRKISTEDKISTNFVHSCIYSHYSY